jgi:hypothetical protein
MNKQKTLYQCYVEHVDKRWLALNIVLAAMKPSIGNVIVAKRKMKSQFIAMRY